MTLVGVSLGGQLNSRCVYCGAHPMSNGDGGVGQSARSEKGCVTFASCFASLCLGNFLIVGRGPRAGKSIHRDAPGKPST